MAAALAALFVGGCSDDGQRAVTTTRVYKELSNGVTVITAENRAGAVVSAQAWVANGAVHDAVDEAGLASLVARMIFDETPTYGPGEITRRIEAVGGGISITPSQDYATFTVTLPSEHTDLALEVLADGLLNPVFTPERVDRVRKQVLSEIESQEDRPIDRVNWVFLEQMLGEHPYARLPQGRAETVSSFTPEELAARHAERYVGENILIVVAGDANPEQTAQRVERLFADVPAGEPAQPAVAEPAWPTDDVRLVEKADVHRAYQLVGFPAPGIHDPGSVEMDVLLTVLGLGRSDRLERELMVERRLVSGVSAGWYTRRQGSPMFVVMELSPENVGEAADATVEIFRGLAANPVDQEELEKAKAFYESQLLFMRETAEGLAGFYGYWTSVSGRAEYADEYIDRIADVTTEDVQQLAATYFAETSHAAVAVVPEWMD
jgi:zinc protease